MVYHGGEGTAAGCSIVSGVLSWNFRLHISVEQESKSEQEAESDQKLSKPDPSNTLFFFLKILSLPWLTQLYELAQGTRAQVFTLLSQWWLVLI